MSENKKCAYCLKVEEKISKNLKSFIEAISKIMDFRDPYTSGHEKRVAQLGVAIAKKMGYSKKRVACVDLICGLHDIGKIKVPSDILSSPSQLSGPEFAILKQHPEIGYEILKDVDFTCNLDNSCSFNENSNCVLATAVLQHHERPDGSGYPNGIKDMLEEASIVAVADVVEAMISHRPYRPAVGLDRALLEIVNNKVNIRGKA